MALCFVDFIILFLFMILDVSFTVHAVDGGLRRWWDEDDGPGVDIQLWCHGIHQGERLCSGTILLRLFRLRAAFSLSASLFRRYISRLRTEKTNKIAALMYRLVWHVSLQQVGLFSALGFMAQAVNYIVLLVLLLSYLPFVMPDCRRHKWCLQDRRGCEVLWRESYSWGWSTSRYQHQNYRLPRSWWLEIGMWLSDYSTPFALQDNHNVCSFFEN